MHDFILSIPAAIGILFTLLLLSAFFSGSETALTRASRARLETMQENRVRGSKRALHLVRHPERMLAAVLLGNNFVNIAASSLATAFLVAYFGEAGIIYATVLMTTVYSVLPYKTPWCAPSPMRRPSRSRWPRPCTGSSACWRRSSPC